MNKEKLEEVVWFIGLGFYALGFLVFLLYKLTYASHYNLSPILIANFANIVILCQSAVLELICLWLIKEFADEKKWHTQVLIYLFAFAVIYCITGGIMGIVDLISGRPYSLL